MGTLSAKKLVNTFAIKRVISGLIIASFGLMLTACTTVEGTNALVDGGTFEREVLRTTLQGVGFIEQESKGLVSVERGPLVIPTSGAVPPAPQKLTASIPQDSNQVVLDANGLSTRDLDILRSGKVVDSSNAVGRPLTEAEARQLTARMQAYNRGQKAGDRNIFFPPESYFARVGTQDTICKAADGSLVAVNDPKCPADVRAAITKK